MGEVGSQMEEPVVSTARDGAVVPGRGDSADSALRLSGKEKHGSGFHRTAGAIRTLVPLLQKMLPLLDGNVASAVANLLAPRLLAPQVDLSPVEEAVARLRGEIARIGDKNAEHDRAFGRIDEQLETIKDALERHSAEQKEVTEQVSRVRARMTIFSVTGLVLLVGSIAVNVAIFVYVSGKVH